jgi:hypothetical protein
LFLNSTLSCSSGEGTVDPERAGSPVVELPVRNNGVELA